MAAAWLDGLSLTHDSNRTTIIHGDLIMSLATERGYAPAFDGGGLMLRHAVQESL